MNGMRHYTFNTQFFLMFVVVVGGGVRGVVGKGVMGVV